MEGNFVKFFKDKKEGIHFKVELQLVENSDIAIIAIHGGLLEFGTETIAREIAKTDYNYYIFIGLKASSYEEMHLTSSQFDDERCLSIIKNCSTVISIHGYKDLEGPILVGGLNHSLKEILCEEFKKNGISAEIATTRLTGTSPHNICNKGRSQKGVQLEIPIGLRDWKNGLSIAAVVRSVIDSKLCGD